MTSRLNPEKWLLYRGPSSLCWSQIPEGTWWGTWSGCWWSSGGQDSAAQEFSKLNFRRQFSNRRKEGKSSEGPKKTASAGEPKEDVVVGGTCSLALLRSISWQWHRSRRLQKSCNNVTNFFVGALSLCRAAVRILFAFPAHFPAHSPLSSSVVRYYMEWCRGYACVGWVKYFENPLHCWRWYGVTNTLKLLKLNISTSATEWDCRPIWV